MPNSSNMIYKSLEEKKSSTDHLLDFIKNKCGQISQFEELPPGKYKKNSSQNSEKFSVLIMEVDKGNGVRQKKYFGIEHEKTEEEERKDVLGSGGFGKARKMYDLETGEKYVLKLQTENRDDDEKQKEQKKNIVRNEVEILKKLDLGGWADPIEWKKTKKDYEDEEDRLEQQLIVMKFASGKPLDKLDLEEKKGEKMISLFNQVLLAIEKIHSKNILHCDIKPANILFDSKTGICNVIDFGLSMQVDNCKEGKKTQTLQGSQGFRAPENSKTGVVNFIYNEKTEVYALAVTLAQIAGLITPRHAFAIENAGGLGNYFNQKEPVTNSENKKIYEYIKKMGSHDPAERPALKEAKEFFNTLQFTQAQTVEAKVVTQPRVVPRLRGY